MLTRRIFIALVSAALLGCTTPWSAVKDYTQERHPPKTVSEDVDSFIELKRIPRKDISEIRYGVDPKGRRAVRISQELPASLGKETVEHVLYYDRNNKRTRVITLHGHRMC